MELFAPKDPQDKRKGFYVLLDQNVGGVPQADGVGRHPIFLDGDRLTTLAKIVGGISDGEILERLTTAKGFRSLVHSIGVSAQAADRDMEVGFTLVFYGNDGPESGSRHRLSVKADGVEMVISLPELEMPDTDRAPGQFLFELPTDRDTAAVTVKLYLNDGFAVPDMDPDGPVDAESPAYREMIARSFLSGGSNYRVKRVLEKLRSGEDVTIAYLGGSITQGAGAVPIQEMCYARKSFEDICSRYGGGGQARYIKAGVGGTPSQLGMLRYDRDIGRDGTAAPDLVVVEFAVNDEGDETKGVCYESLVKKILDQPQKPAVILLFSVFANDWNLKDRLAPIGFRYQLPMVDVLEAVSPQFALPKGAGRVLSKRQYFYDVYHPSNLGHRIMADCLLYLLDRLDRQQAMPEPPEDVPPFYGTEYAGVRLLDGKDGAECAAIDPGSFTQRDEDLQSVPLDGRKENTPQFPYNWRKGPGDAPFVMEISCRSLHLIFKDSGSPEFGKARVCIDGGPARILDPREAGWTHCHATLLFSGPEAGRHRIELSMDPEDADKTFTILGFGYVP